MCALDNAHALIVGIAAYDTDRLDPLPATRRDSQDMYDLLIDPQYCAYPKSRVQLLQDPEATKDNLLEGFEQLAERSDEDSNVFIYVSCHGGRVESSEHAGEYLLPFDTDYTSAATVADTAISGETFSEALRAIPARKVAVMFDACHAGGIGQPKNATAAKVKSGLSEDYYRALATGRGRVIIASSRETEESWIIPRDARNSLFTKHLLDGLRGGVPGPDGLIRINDLFHYLQPKVKEDQPKQHPILKAEIEENFPIALHLGGEETPIPSSSLDDGFEYDVFISYRHQEPDKTWVRKKLLPRLESQGLRICIDYKCFRLGRPLVNEMERAVIESRYTLAVLTSAYEESGFTDLENIMADHLGRDKKQSRFLSVLLEDYTPRLRFRSRYHLDMTDHDEIEENVSRLIYQLRQPPNE